MARDKGFYTYIATEVFSDIEGITSRQMFGGYGFYKDGIFFALIAEGKLYFKVGKSNKDDYEQYNSKPFNFEMKNGKVTTMSYWEVPETILEEREALSIWIEKAVLAAKESKKK